MGKTNTKEIKSSLTEERFLRSINIVLDANDTDRIAHFFPTAKSSKLIEQLLGETDGREFLVSAPYGSGKSLAQPLLQIVENNKKTPLNGIINRLSEVDKNLSKKFQSRLKEEYRGLGIALEGAIESLPLALVEAAKKSLSRLNKLRTTNIFDDISEKSDIKDALEAIRACVHKAKLDRVVIYWDEFGRHLEHLVAKGLTGNLHDVQTLAEFVSRQKKNPWVLSVFLHHGLMAYGIKLPTGAKNEWKKIEGRFQAIDYIEDSKEVYRLLSEIVSSRKPNLEAPTQTKIKEVVKKLKTLGQWKDFTQAQLTDLLKKSWPLNPIGLELFSIWKNIKTKEPFTFLFNQKFDEK